MPQAALVTQITGAPMRTVRPLMLREVYANPEKELARLHRQGRVTKIAAGTYVAKPDDVEATTPWKPNFEEAAMAYATAAYGPRVPVLYGLGAARKQQQLSGRWPALSTVTDSNAWPPTVPARFRPGCGRP